MTVRSKESTNTIWGRRSRRGSRDTEHADRGELVSSRRSRRQGGQSQDRALYACGCGLVFDALVSTSVDCPECGSTQAW